MTRKATGASYPAVSDRVVLDLFIPMPSIGQQHRIADLLDKADAIRRKRREALALTGDLLRSVFLDMFGDPVANPRGWDTTTLGSLAKDVRYGTSEKCSVNQTPDSRPVLRIPNVAEGEIRWVDLKFASIESPEAERLALDRGDLLFVRSNGNPEYIARCAVYESDRPAVFASYLIRVRLERNEFPTYVQAALSMPSYRSVLTRAARTTAGNYNISSEGLRDLRLPIPPSDRIARFGAVRSGIARERQLLQAAEAESERLFFALVHQSFCEE
jgi:type I restriction enzyme S subunit